MIYFCCDQPRRNDLIGKSLNGIDYLEVLDHEATTPADRQRRLFVHFINDIAPALLAETNLQIEGGERIRNIAINKVSVGIGSEAKVLTVDVNQPGDFSIYILRLVQDQTHSNPPGGIDPMFAAVDFSFKVECPSDFDCAPRCECTPVAAESVEIDYLAKDYSSFRRLMLDRIAFLMPDWQERHTADLGVALVEVLAFVGDYLSYQQDAIATEAYLGTARRRVSIRRHAKLVDYAMHDGCNARVWVQVQVGSDIPLLPAGTLLCTRITGQTPAISNDPIVLAMAQEFFETMEDAGLFSAHNELQFYAWSDQRCCLPKGATNATLSGTFPNLKIGEVLVLEEIVGPKTGTHGDADLGHRWPIRLTDVEIMDAQGKVLVDPLTAVPITQIRWADADALPFPLCISSLADELHSGQYIEKVSVARGNIILADHGQTQTDEDLGAVPEAMVDAAMVRACDPCNQKSATPVPARYRPLLAKRPLTFAVPNSSLPVISIEFVAQDITDLDNKKFPLGLENGFKGVGITIQPPLDIQGSHPLWSIGNDVVAYIIKQKQSRLNAYIIPVAASTTIQPNKLRSSLPAIRLKSQLNLDKLEWTPKQDLLESGPSNEDFVVETETDGRAWLRFGDDVLGRRPDSGTRFSASYRIGNGVAGNVGAESIAHLVLPEAKDNAVLRNTLLQAVTQVRNPVPAYGGVEPESMEQVRAYAPVAFRTQERAVTEADYAEVTERHPGIQRAMATFRWTGSWHTVFITVDRLGGLPVDASFKTEIRGFVERFRMAGYDLEVDAPRFVSLKIEMHICIQSDYFREEVKGELLNIFSNRILPDGRRGMFHPDNFTFGQTVYLSPLIAAAQEVEGVGSVQVLTFQRQDMPDLKPLALGKLEVSRLEIVRCANDPNFAEHGVFKMTLGGGR